MKAVENDWCHFVQRLERTKTQMFLKGAEKNYEDEKYIYLLASRTRKPDLTGNRVLAKPHQFSHRIDILYCSAKAETPQQVKIHKKSHKTLFKRVKKLKRGDLVIIPEDLQHQDMHIPE